MYGENMANMANMAMANMPHMENIPYMTSPYGYEPCDYGYSYPVTPVAGVGNKQPLRVCYNCCVVYLINHHWCYLPQ